jgi:hypothetical protein
VRGSLEEDQTIEELLARGDELMYVEKRRKQREDESLSWTG